MKTILLLLLLLPTLARCQLFVILEPQFLRPGILYNHTFEKYGVWGKMWYGDIRGYNYADSSNFYTQNIKLSAGISLSKRNAKFYFGLNYNHFFDTQHNGYPIQLDRIHPISFDLGMSVKVRRFTGVMMTDILNWESCIGVSYHFKQSKCPAFFRYKKS